MQPYISIYLYSMIIGLVVQSKHA